MKTILKTCLNFLFLLICTQTLSAFSDSLSVNHLENLPTEERLSIIQSEIDRTSGDAKKELLEHFIQISTTKNWPNIQANAEKQLGLFYYYAGEYVAALTHYQKALTLFEILADHSKQGEMYNLLATLSKKQKDYDRANKYLDKTLKLCTLIKDSICISTVYDNRGLIYAEQQDFKKAKEYYLVTLDIRNRIKDTIGLGYVYSNLAEVAINESLFEQAEKHLLLSNVYKKLSSDQFGEAVNYTNLGELYFKQKKYSKSTDFFQRSLEISNQIGVPDLSQWNYRYLSRTFSELGDTKQALNFLSQSYELKDSLLTVGKLSQITEMETKFDTERKEQQIKLQNLEIENQKQRNQNQLMMAGGILAILALGFSILFLNYRNRQKGQLQQAQISYQRTLLSTTIETQEKERLRISKDLHDGIGQQLSGLKMAWEQFGKTIRSQAPEKSEQLDQLKKVLGDAANEVRSISHQMMPKALQEYGLLAAVEDLLSKTFEPIAIGCDFDHFGIDGRFPQNIELSTFRILQELINNIIKHAEATEVSIQLMVNKKNLVMVVVDNGKGLGKKLLDNKGHGMMNMQSRAQLVNGTLEFENAHPGTTVNLRIPLEV